MATAAAMVCISQVSAWGTKSWFFRYHARRSNREKWVWGRCLLFSLAEARDQALACRKLLQQGIDPIEARKSGKAAQLAAHCAADNVPASGGEICRGTFRRLEK